MLKLNGIEYVLIVFILINIFMLGAMAEILTIEQTLYILYMLSLLSLLQISKFSRKAKELKDKVIKKCIRLPKIQTEEETFQANLYVKRWRQIHLEQPPAFPLDRLAYLNAKYYSCNRRHVFFIKHAQIKSLSKKYPKTKTVDTVHPLKMVTNFFATYIHRRAMFYRSRKTNAVEKRQYTKINIDNELDSKMFSNSSCILYPKQREDSFFEDKYDTETLLPKSTEKKEKVRRSILKKLSDIYDSIVGIKLKELSKRKSSASTSKENDISDIEEFDDRYSVDDQESEYSSDSSSNTEDSNNTKTKNENTMLTESSQSCNKDKIDENQE